MEFTGERFIPGQDSDRELTIEHLQRYDAITRLVQDKVVLDAACGEGYGSYNLAKHAKHVYGLDISNDTIEGAKNKYKDKNLEFIQGSIIKLPFEEKSVDVIVSFETIEHVDQQMQENFMDEIKRVLKPNGILIISTPNKKIYSDEFNYKNEYHIKEFYKNEFIDFISRYFSNVELYSQYKEIAYYLTNNKMKDINKQGLYEEDYAKYYICIAGNKELPVESISTVTLENELSYINTMHRILNLQDEMETRNNHITTLDKKIQDLNTKTVNLQDEVEVRNNHISTLDEKIQDLDTKTVNLQDEVEVRNNHISTLDENMVHKENEIVSLKDEIVSLKDEIVSLKDEIVFLKDEINNKLGHVEQLIVSERNLKGHVAQLLESDRELENIKQSLRWKVADIPHKIGHKVFPENTKRLLALQLGKNVLKNPKLYLRRLNGENIKTLFRIMKSEGIGRASEKISNFQEMHTAVTKQNITLISPDNKFEKITLPKYENPLVSIIIPVYNQFQYTYDCIKSIQRNTTEIPYEIIIADDVSTDKTVDIATIVENIIVCRNKENLGFLLNCNNAAKHAKGKYIHFLNNDTQVQQEWLTSLVDLIESDEKIGLVGSKLIYPNEMLQEAGGIFWNDASAWNYGNKSDAEMPDYNYVKEVDYISGASILISKVLWEKIGGFDERYIPAYYEDSDLAFEVRKQGYKVMYQPKSVIVHFEGISNGTDTSSGLKSYQLVNQKKFYEKWKDILEAEHYPNGESVFNARDRMKNKKRVLVIDHYVPHFDRDAGSKCTFNYISLFKYMGLGVTFIGDNFFPHQPYTEVLQQMGVNVIYGDWYHDHYKKWLQENGKHFDYVYLNRPHISIKYIDLLKKYTKAKIIYFGHDLHYLRELRNYEIEKDEQLLKESERWKKIEFELFDKADVVYVVGEYEQKVLQKQLPEKIIRNIPVYIYEKSQEPTEMRFKDRKDLLFVGGFNHKPNTDGILWFYNEVFPLIKKQVPDIKLYVVGSNPPQKVQDLNSEDVIITGFISDEELTSLYNNCKIVVAPLRFGAGVKGKVVEAIYNQVPTVTTSIGAEGLTEIEKYLSIADDNQEFAQKVIGLYQNEDNWDEMSINMIQYIDSYFSQDTAYQIVKQDVE